MTGIHTSVQYGVAVVAAVGILLIVAAGRALSDVARIVRELVVAIARLSTMLATISALLVIAILVDLRH